ncbi:FAD-dependent monooxygenase spyC [Aspergillus ibericus CBS 121593]|uniref:FAD binding monooxygenase n=1 Tax=Aspergillus ibericus CBS 121593 TaxID=1448316 RepID=A0A395H832_9EURO|nr:FAD binding monooxygenase [Aspergillus ibericus CBS 121593]RAL03305.1 FAD binding monooxygenase [Aspergillus ibericus CBS 121593]
MPKPQFTVIIVGGGIAGLTLAHCLYRANIHHIILEKHTDLSPQVGASIGILPNGARILDQLSLYEHIEKHIEPLDKAHVSYPDGFAFTSLYPRILLQRFGYPIAFFDRQKVLEILHTQYPQPSNIYTNQRVSEVHRVGSHVEVVTDSGARYIGDLVVGADGVHSKVRSEIWRMAEKLHPGLVTQKEMRSMSTEFCCVFGISSSVPMLEIGDQVNAFQDGLSIITIIGKDGRAFWFVIKKLDRKYTYPQTIRFNDEAAARLCEGVADVQLMAGLTFAQVWKTRLVSSMTMLEENVFHTWHCGRVVCIGDSVHKMTPNIGQGANMAIEDAAVLANLLHKKLGHGEVEGLSDAGVNALLHEFHSIRYSRVKSIYIASRYLVRLQARDGLLNKLLGRYCIPYAPDIPAVIGSRSIRGSPSIDFLPLPARSGPGWSKYRSGEGRYILSLLTVLLVVVASYSF